MIYNKDQLASLFRIDDHILNGLKIRGISNNNPDHVMTGTVKSMDMHVDSLMPPPWPHIHIYFEDDTFICMRDEIEILI